MAKSLSLTKVGGPRTDEIVPWSRCQKTILADVVDKTFLYRVRVRNDEIAWQTVKSRKTRDNNRLTSKAHRRRWVVEANPSYARDVFTISCPIWPTVPTHTRRVCRNDESVRRTAMSINYGIDPIGWRSHLSCDGPKSRKGTWHRTVIVNGSPKK